MRCLALALALPILGACKGGDKGITPDDSGLTDPDRDGDGFPVSEDCDDSDPAVSPDAVEVCDGFDNDCDGQSDDADDSTDDGSKQAWYADRDADSYGAPDDTTLACVQPAGFTADATDCDDGDEAIYPGAREVCDGVDDDCDGLVDLDDPGLDLDSAALVYDDGDGDGYGWEPSAAWACALTSGAVSVAGDCDDADPDINPAAPDEACDEVDGDCNGFDGDLAADADGATYAAAFSTIQDAIDAATGGELLCVAPGTYTENVVVEGKDLRMVALACALDPVEGCWDDTVLDGDESGSVVTFVDASDSGLISAASELIGFTLQNGRSPEGGGLALDHASPTLSWLHILNNRAEDGGDPAGGGGLWVSGAALSLRDAVIEDNAADCDDDEACLGGGLYLDCQGEAAALEGVQVSGNRAGAGGGLWAADCALETDTTDFRLNLATGQSGAGGGLALEGGTLDMRYAFVSANSAVAAGGGLAMVGEAGSSSLTLDTVVVEDNTLANPEGPAYGGGLYAANTDAQIHLSFFTDNEASSAEDDARGGGLYLEDSPFHLGDCVVSRNGAVSAGSVRGGGVEALFASVSADVSNVISLCTFEEDWAESEDGDADGGGLSVTNASSYAVALEVGESDVKDSYALASRTAKGGAAALTGVDLSWAGLPGDPDVVSGGSATSSDLYAYGGGLYLSGGSAALADLILSDNSLSAPLAALGGGISASSLDSLTLANVDLQENTTGASASAAGGGAYLSDVASGSWDSGAVAFNHSEIYGGGLFLGTVGASGAAFALSGLSLQENDAQKGGGAYLGASVLDFSDVDFTDNVSEGEGGGLLQWYGGEYSFAGLLVTGNRSKSGAGGGARMGGFVGTADTTITMEDATFFENALACDWSDRVGGAGLSVSQPSGTTLSLEIDGGSFEGNVSAPGTESYSCHAGGLYFHGDSLVLKNIDFTRNESYSAGDLGGGGAHLVAAGSASPNVSLESVRFEANFDVVGGGGLALDADAALDDVQFIANQAGAYGGGLAGGGTLSLTDVDFEENEACLSSGYSTSCSAGGLYFYGDALSLDTVSLLANRASTNSAGASAGATIVATTVTATGLRVAENQDVGAGGGGMTIGPATSVSVEDADFEGNVGEWGGLLLWGAGSGGKQTADLSNVRFASNEGDFRGGGLWACDGYNDADLELNVTNAIFVGNTSAYNGGALYLCDNAAVTLINTAMVANEAGASSGNGGAIYASASTDALTVINSTFAWNTAANQGGAVRVNPGPTVSVLYSHGYANTDKTGTSHFSGVSVFDGVNGDLLDVDPEFADTSSADPADWDLSLTGSSPLVDAGSPSVLDADGSVSDIGAYGGPGGAAW